jgi:DNA-binding PadR family transcriptional regulator
MEPIVLYMLRENGATHGYQLAASLQQHALTDAEIEGAAMYRTLRRLEEHGYVLSKWDIQSRGPARRIQPAELMKALQSAKAQPIILNVGPKML